MRASSHLAFLLICAALPLAACSVESDDDIQPQGASGKADDIDEGAGPIEDGCSHLYRFGPFADCASNPACAEPRLQDSYGDGICDDHCMFPDPDCLDCETQARMAVDHLELSMGNDPEALPTANKAETLDRKLVTDKGVSMQMIRVTAADGRYSYVVTAEPRKERSGAETSMCTIHGLQRETAQDIDPEHPGGALIKLLDGMEHPVAEPPSARPSTECRAAVIPAVQAMENQHSWTVIAADGERSIFEGEPNVNGRTKFFASESSEVDADEPSGIVLVSKDGSDELIRVRVDRSKGWEPETDTYLVHTKFETPIDLMDTENVGPEFDFNNPDLFKPRCVVVGLQNREYQVDMRPEACFTEFEDAPLDICQSDEAFGK